MFKLSERSKQRLEGVDKRLIEVIEKALTISKVDFGIPEYGGIRREEEQHKLFLDGKSKCDGRYKKSKHQLGKAFDVYAYVDGKASWEVYHLSQVACAILQSSILLGYKLQWGGLWVNFLDTPHFELIE